MNIPARKICMLGDFAVGKTSLVARTVRNTFSDLYQTTIGVKVDSKLVETADAPAVRLVLWDIAGAGVLDQVRASYLAGASGLILVADGTRLDTLDTAGRLYEQAIGLLKDDVPNVLLLNKSDLASEWALPVTQVDTLVADRPVFSVSARSGHGVEDAFEALARLLR